MRVATIRGRLLFLGLGDLDNLGRSLAILDIPGITKTDSHHDLNVPIILLHVLAALYTALLSPMHILTINILIVDIIYMYIL